MNSYLEQGHGCIIGNNTSVRTSEFLRMLSLDEFNEIVPVTTLRKDKTEQQEHCCDRSNWTVDKEDQVEQEELQKERSC